MILDQSVQHLLLDSFGFLAKADAGFRRAFFESTDWVQLPAGQCVGRQGETCAQLALVLAGSVRVYRLGENGREITLYRIQPGESCVLTASCILRHAPFPAFAECETAVDAVLVDQWQVERWLRDYSPWRELVFGLVSGRLVELIELLDAVVFQRLEQRLARYLLARLADAGPDGISTTHQIIAAELGSSREVVSRMLGMLDGRGILATGRGRVRVLDPEAVVQIADAM